jgi:head-tail adaptor
MVPGQKVVMTLRKRTRVSDGRGGSVDIWNFLEDFKAVLTPGTVGSRTGNEGDLYNKETTAGYYAIYAKKPVNTITTFDRLWFEGRIFEIKAVYYPVSTKKFIKCDLKELS